MVYKVMDRETNNGTFGIFGTRAEAEQFILDSEREDMKNGLYEENYYQIVEFANEEEL